MMASTRAELLRLLKWPTTWVMAGIWLVMNFFFAYLLTYLSYRSAVSDGQARVAAGLLADMSPASLPPTLVQGMPMFGGAIVLILSALATGSGYGWGTWKTVLIQGPGRLSAFAGTLVALAVIVVGLVLATLALDVASSLAVMAAEGQAFDAPTGTSLAEGVGAALLIMSVFALGGALLGVVARGPALSVGLGLVWVLVVENLLRGVAGLLSPLKAVTDVLPGTAAGSLAGAMGASGVTGPDANGTPGVLSTLTGDTAAALLLVYGLAFVLVLGTVVRRRDA